MFKSTSVIQERFFCIKYFTSLLEDAAKILKQILSYQKRVFKCVLLNYHAILESNKAIIAIRASYVFSLVTPIYTKIETSSTKLGFTFLFLFSNANVKCVTGE